MTYKKIIFSKIEKKYFDLSLFTKKYLKKKIVKKAISEKKPLFQTKIIIMSKADIHANLHKKSGYPFSSGRQGFRVIKTLKKFLILLIKLLVALMP